MTEDRQKKIELGSLRCKLHPLYNGQRMPMRSPLDKKQGCTCQEFFEAKRERFFERMKKERD